MKDKVSSILHRHNWDKSLLVSVLQDVQAEYNYLPREALVEVGAGLGLSLSHVYSVATFYKAFSLKPRGRHLAHVCVGTACHVRGAGRILEKLSKILGVSSGTTTHDMNFTLETVNCVGACALGPLVVVDGQYSGLMTDDKVKSLMEKYN